MKRMIIWLVILTMLVTALPGTLPAAQATMCAQHTWSAWQQEREATCTSPGWQTRYCTVCGNGWDSREYPPALGFGLPRFGIIAFQLRTCFMEQLE